MTDIKQITNDNQSKNLSTANKICISMRCTGNNTIRTAWDPTSGKTLKTTSAGRMGLKGARRGSPYAAEMVGRELGRQLKDSISATAAKGVSTSITVLFSGHNVAIGSGLRGLRIPLRNTLAQVVSLIDITPKPHNGCRARKPRRV